jgi:putative glycosyltransferase (TIGR04372 family)
MKSKVNSLYSIKNNYPFHQSYRDSDISTYLPAIQWLTQRNIFVFRMGSIANTAVDYKNKYFIDYAFMPTRSDFLDIWLFANSNGVISTGTGPDQLAVLYNKPLLYVNHLPLFHLPTYAQSITVPKNLIFKQTKIPLTLDETLKYSSTATSIQQPFNPLRYEDYSNNGIEIIDLTKQEILEATKEFWSRICNVWVESDKERLLQNSFWRQFQSHKDYHQMHNWKHPKAYVGSDWLKSQGENFLKNES